VNEEATKGFLNKSVTPDLKGCLKNLLVLIFEKLDGRALSIRLK
jgi:hypothetical protein